MKELKDRIVLLLKTQKDPVTAEQMMNQPEIEFALFQVLRSALDELKAEGKIKGIAPDQTELEQVGAGLEEQ